MGSKMILYRGSLKSCNYHCSYCPYSKHQQSARQLNQDREQWFRFCESYERRAPFLDIGALMVVPYGEALIHPWYWEGLAHISALPSTDEVGAQTNLSFSVEQSLTCFQQAGGLLEKLRLWATFHPEMTSPEHFAKTVENVHKTGVQLCVGAVGIPKHLELLKRLQQIMPKDVYLWINRMDGLERPYTAAEKKAFCDIDPYFSRELAFVHADRSKCEGRLFVEADGRMRTCNLGVFLNINWYAADLDFMPVQSPCIPQDASASFPSPVCNRKRCSCYLAYGGRTEAVNRILFGQYPLFRIPRKPKAVFWDIDGTLIPEGEKSIPSFTQEGLIALKQDNTVLLFATTLPYEDAMRRCREIQPLFSGGIFAGGAHLRLKFADQIKEHFFAIPENCIPALDRLRSRFQFRLLIYRREDIVYKITLLRPRHIPWEPSETEAVFCELPSDCQKSLRYFTEHHCLELVAKDADKTTGVKLMCRWLGIHPLEAAAAGNSKEDLEMMQICGDS